MAKTRIPLAVEAMLREDRRPHTKPDLSRKPAEALQRLRWICDEIDKRICEEPDEMRFGDIDGFVDEAHNLAFELGFADPPVERIRYERGQSTGACSQCRWRLQSAAGGPFGWGLKPSTWPIYTMKPAVMRVDGYRFHDPDRGAVPAELLLVCVCDTDADGRQHLHDAWEKRPKIEERADAVKLLRRWSRFIGEQVTTPDREPYPSGDTGATGGNAHPGYEVSWMDELPEGWIPNSEAVTLAHECGNEYELPDLSELDVRGLNKLLRRRDVGVRFMSKRTGKPAGRVHKADWQNYLRRERDRVEATEEAIETRAREIAS